jgi:hypothetical protein
MNEGPGRPTEYTDERIADITKKLLVYTASTIMPLWCDFCYNNKVNFRRAQDLCKKSEEFREAYEEMHAKEEAVLLKGGIAGKFNASITTLVLKNHRMSVDYREKEEVGRPKDYSDFFEDIKKRANERRKKRAEKPNG